MSKSPVPHFILPALAVFFGLAILGFYTFSGLKTFSDKDRVVTVKGLAEMNMKATSGTIALSFSYSGDDLQELLRQSEAKKLAVAEYLESVGYASGNISLAKTGVVDRQKYYETQWYNNQPVEVKIDRYTISQGLSVQSSEVEGIEDKASQINLDLVSKNLTCDVSTAYTFAELNSIKPQLIAESTKNARIAGEQFANDSQAELGKIKTASQGQITLAGRYYYDEESGTAPEEPYLQKARVVSTIVFFLE